MFGKIFITSFVCVGLLILYGCNLPGEDETYSLSQGQLVDYSGAYFVEVAPEPGFNSFTLYHTGNKIHVYDNLGRTWKGDASGISQTEAGAFPVVGEEAAEEVEVMHVWQMQFSIETLDPATGRKAVIIGVGNYYGGTGYSPFTGWYYTAPIVEISGEYWTNYGPKGMVGAHAWSITEKVYGEPIELPAPPEE